MTSIATYAASADSLLEASQHLHSLGALAHAHAARDLAEHAMIATREAITKALAQPGDAWQRRALLDAAIELDGVASPLAAKAARCLAEAAAEAASALAAAA